MDSAESADNRWFGIGVTSISGVRDPSSLEYGIQSNFTYKQEGVVKTLYPNITYNGKTYIYAATGTENADKEGYYTLIPARVNIANGANAGNNRYNPTASGKTYHQDYTMVMNEKNIYTITYNVMDPGETTYGVLNDYSQRVDAGTSENKLKQPASKDVPIVKTDSAGNQYTFSGWYKDQACTVKANFDGSVTANTNYYGKYVAETYTVKYDSNGGTLVADKTLKYNDVVDTSETPTKEGYIFNGWYYGDTKVTNQKYATLAKDESTKEITLVAHWKENLKASADNVVKEYDGNAYGITVNTNVKDATIKYWNKNKGKYDLTESPTKTNVTRDTDGNITSLTVKYEVSKEGYKTVYGEATVTITPRQVKLTSEGGTKPYDGTALTKPDVTVSGDGFVEGEVSDIKATGSVTTVGEGKVTNTITYTPSDKFKEKNYTITKHEGELSITEKSIIPDGPNTPEEKKTGIKVTAPKDTKYNGKEQKKEPVIEDTKTGKTLDKDDYSLSYSDDVTNAGTVTITVTGKRNYSGKFEVTYKINPRKVTLKSTTASKPYDGTALTKPDVTVSGDGFVEGEGASYEVTGTQTEVGNSANAFEYKLNEKTLASNYNITKVVGTLTITAAPAPVTPATPSTPSTPSSTTSTTLRTPSAPQVTTPVETVEKETTPKAEPKKEEKVEEEYTPKASPQYYWALINLICAILTVLFGLLLLISKRHKDEDDDEEDDETKQQTNNDDEEKEQEKKRGLFTRVLAVLIAIVSVVFFLVTEDLSLPWTWTDQWTIWMVVIGLVQIVVFFVGRKWKNVDNDDEDEEAQQA